MKYNCENISLSDSIDQKCIEIMKTMKWPSYPMNILDIWLSKMDLRLKINELVGLPEY